MCFGLWRRHVEWAAFVGRGHWLVEVSWYGLSSSLGAFVSMSHEDICLSLRRAVDAKPCLRIPFCSCAQAWQGVSMPVFQAGGAGGGSDVGVIQKTNCYMADLLDNGVLLCPSAGVAHACVTFCLEMCSQAGSPVF